MKKNRDLLLFDIETGGLSGEESSILSISYRKKGKTSSLFARPEVGTKISRWSENKVWNPIKEKANKTEKEILTDFLQVVEQQKGKTVGGWNIGVAATPQGKNVRGFDIPMLITRAEKHGLGEQYQKAFSQVKIRDIGREFALHTAREVVKNPGLVEETLERQALGYVKKAESFSTPFKKTAGLLAYSNVQMSGWKQELAYGIAFGKGYEAHQSESDVEAIEKILGSKKGVFTGPEFVKKWGKEALRNKLTNKAFIGATRSEAPGEVWKNIIQKAEQFGIQDIQENIQKNAQEKGANLVDLMAGRGHKEVFSEVRDRAVKTPSFFSKAVGAMKAHPLATIAGVGIGSFIFKPLSLFSGKDDSYNTIEGLEHKGVAGATRRGNTDFGSGYQGLPETLMGVPIDPQILEYRANIHNDPEKRKEVQRRLKLKEEEQAKKIGELTEPDYLPERGDLEILNQNRESRQIDLSSFDLSVEDADTLTLKRKSGSDKEIQIRLAGIDAPETTSHEEDPLEEVRIWQDQPEGERSSKRLREIIEEQKNLSLTVSGERTYGRYVGVLGGDNGKNLNLQLISEGQVSALPFGERSEDLISRDIIDEEQNKAFSEGKGIWANPRYQATKIATGSMGSPLTFNTLTRIDKLAGNLALGAYASFLQDVGDQEKLSEEQMFKARSFGKVLRKYYPSRFSGKDDSYNTIEGLRHGWYGKQRRENTDFGSGFIGEMAGSVKAFMQMSRQEAKKGLARALKKTTITRDPNKPMSSAIQIANDLSISSSLNFNIKRFTGWKNEIKELTPTMLAHEMSEISYITKQRVKIFSEAGRNIPEIQKRLKESKFFGSHSSPGVIADELLYSAKMGKKEYSVAKQFRERELDLFKQKIKAEKKTGNISQEMEELEKYVNRTEKMISSFEKKWLPKFDHERKTGILKKIKNSILNREANRTMAQNSRSGKNHEVSTQNNTFFKEVLKYTKLT